MERTRTSPRDVGLQQIARMLLITPTLFHLSFGQGMCGPKGGDAFCQTGFCCSKYGYCGTTIGYCGSGNCQSQCPSSTSPSETCGDGVLCPTRSSGYFLGSEEVNTIARDLNRRHSINIGIDCISTTSQSLVQHHGRRSCCERERTDHLDSLLRGAKYVRLSKRPSRALKSVSSVERMKKLESNTFDEENNRFATATARIPVAIKQNPKIHTIFSAECNDYFDWQTLGLYHSFQLSGQPGFITRLLSCTAEKLETYKSMDLAPTHVVPSYTVHPLTGDKYPAINKPAAVYHWLNHVQMDVEYVVIIDADMILRGPITPWEFGASKGHPVAAAYEYLRGCDNELAQLHTRYPEYCQKVGGVIIMHIDDLRVLAPLWLHKTEEVRADKTHWSTNLTGDIYGNGWISEMYGYAFGAAELRLKHTINKDFMLYPGYIPADGVEPRVLHYGLLFTIGNWSWDKHSWHYSDMTSTCWTLFPAPLIPDRMSYSSKYEYQRDMLNFECIKILNEALTLYHKRKGCQKKHGEKQTPILEHKTSDEMLPQTEALHIENVSLVVNRESKLSSEDLDAEVLKGESKRQNLSEKFVSNRYMLSKERAAVFSNQYGVIFVWGSLVLLLMFRISASYSRRRKERVV